MTDADDGPGPARSGAGSEPDPTELRLALEHAEQLAGEARPDAHGGVAADPGAARVLDALDRTRGDLARHGDDLVRQAPAMPPSVLAGLDRALAAERSARPAPAPSRAGSPRPAGPRPAGTRPSLLPPVRAIRAPAAAGAVLLVLIVVLTGLGGAVGAPDGPAPRAGGPPAAGPPVLAPADVGDVAVALRTGLGRTDYGPLSDPARRAACLVAHGVPPGVTPAGAREVVFEGRPAVLFVLTTGVAARFRVLVVDARCGAGQPLTLAERVVGR